MIKDKQKLLKFMRWIPVLGILSISIILIIISSYGINKYFDEKAQKLEKNIKKEIIQNSKKNITTLKTLSNDVNRVILDSYKREVKISVDIAMILIDTIYNNNNSYPEEKIIEKIKKELRRVRFFSDKSGYYFVYDKNGNVVLLPIKPSLEDKNLWNHQDIKGKYIIQDLIDGSKKKRADRVFQEWYYYIPNTNIMGKKLGYARYYKKLDLMVGTALYYKNIKEEMKKRFLEIVSKIDKTKYSTLSIFDENRHLIYTSGSKMQSQCCNQKIFQLAKPDTNKIYIDKSSDKMIKIATYYKPLKLLMISTIDTNKIDKIIKKNKKEVIENITHKVLQQFLLTAIIFILLSLFISLKLSKIMEKMFLKYEKSIVMEKNRAEKSTKAKSEFLANMSHEIRTPLNAMFGFIQILQSKNFSKEDKEHLNIIEKSGQNLLTIINDILDFSKIEAGKFNIDRTVFNPQKNICVVHELFSGYASEKNILLKINTENLKYNIISDETRLKQVIANLLSNAIKFTLTGKKIELNISYDDKNQKLFVEVTDEGIGISKDKLDTIFQAFTQADNSTTRKYGGTGLGLTISYRLIQLLGGELKVESELNKGSRFYFEIPAEKSSKIVKDEDRNSKPTKDIKFDYHILLVEDNSANQAFMKVLLKKIGVTFDIANNGLEAIEKFKTNKYDIILMDENMPIMNGTEATKNIRRIEKEKNLSHITIVALTANSLEGDEEKFLKVGMDMYLSKPLNIRKLINVFEELKRK